MAIAFDPAKREKNLRKHGYDLADAEKVFAGLVVEMEDDRFDYGEVRIITVGLLAKKVVVVVWTPRGEDEQVISLRPATRSEADDFFKEVG